MHADNRFHGSIPLMLAVVGCLLAGPAAAQTWQIDYDPGLGTKPSTQGWTHIHSDPRTTLFSVDEWAPRGPRRPPTDFVGPEGVRARGCERTCQASSGLAPMRAEAQGRTTG